MTRLSVLVFLMASCHQPNTGTVNEPVTKFAPAASDTIRFEEVAGKHWMIVNAIFRDSISAKMIVDNGTKWAIYLDEDFAIKNRLIRDPTETGKFMKQPLPFVLNHIRDTVLNTVIFDLKNVVGKEPDGLLGHDFLTKYIIEINYKQKYLYLHHPASFQAPRGYALITMKRNSARGTQREIKLSVFLSGGKRMKDEAVLDLGAGSHELFFGGGATRKHGLLSFTKGQQPKTLGRYVTREENLGYELHADSIYLGGVMIRNVRAALSTSKTGLSGFDTIRFGNGILRNFGIVFLDLGNNRLFVPAPGSNAY